MVTRLLGFRADFVLNWFVMTTAKIERMKMDHTEPVLGLEYPCCASYNLTVLLNNTVFEVNMCGFSSIWPSENFETSWRVEFLTIFLDLTRD